MRLFRVVAALALTFSVASPAAAQEPVEGVNARRPAALIPLYVAHVTLHGLDLHSTIRAIDHGHREANPLMKTASSKQMMGAKLASSAVTVYLAEKLWKKNRVVAVVVMAGVNAALAGVVAHNYRITKASVR